MAAYERRDYPALWSEGALRPVQAVSPRRYTVDVSDGGDALAEVVNAVSGGARVLVVRSHPGAQGD